MKSVIIIGAGIGGLSAAIRLAVQGVRVTILEQNDAPGGKMREVHAEGFRWDTGPSVITMRPVLEELFASAGRRLEDELALTPVEPLTRYFYEDGVVLDASRDRALMAERIGRIDRADVAGYAAYLDHAGFLHRVTGPLFVYGPRPALADLLKFNPLDALRMEPFSRLSTSIGRRVRSPHMRQLLGRFATYVGTSPYLAPATLGVISHVELNEGVWYPRGGVFTIARALDNLARSVGVHIRLNTEAQEIIVRGGRATGVRLPDGEELHADALLANVDAASVYNQLLPQGAAPKKRTHRLGSARFSCSGFMLLLGIAREHPQMAHHNIFFCRDYPQEFADIFKRGVPPAEPTVYVSISSKTDAQDAPSGCENWYVLVNAPPLGAAFDWHAQARGYREVVLNQLKRFGFDLRDHIMVERMITPLDIEANSRSWRGALYGELFDSPWVAFRRPGSRAGDIEGLYLAGGTVHPGGGVPMVMLSGKLAANAILTDLNH